MKKLDLQGGRSMNSRILKLGAATGGVVVLALGGAAIARATGAFDDGDSNLAGVQADRAKTAALQLTGGGHANAVERDSEHGATYEVEVTKSDGNTVDVRLDENFKLVVIDGDSESNDSSNDG
jgi:uncharacterized membrane protein YkoI